MTRIKELREQRNLTQKELANLLGISDRSTFGKYERGVDKIPRKYVKKLSELFSETPWGIVEISEQEWEDYNRHITKKSEVLKVPKSERTGKKSKEKVYKFNYIKKSPETFAVIDTETNWIDEVMSIGIVVADSKKFEPIEAKYWIITPEDKVGGMFSDTLELRDKKMNVKKSREDSIGELQDYLQEKRVMDLFAYNASFDYRHLPELFNFQWHDIISLAAYKQHNPKIPQSIQCYKTGRMMRGYSVEDMYSILSDGIKYQETHNALNDAHDELKIMQMLSHNIEKYPLLEKKPISRVRPEERQIKIQQFEQRQKFQEEIKRSRFEEFIKNFRK